MSITISYDDNRRMLATARMVWDHTKGKAEKSIAGEEMTLTIIHKRLAPHLEEILGKRAFDQGENQGGKAPLETFLNSKTQTANTLQEAFDEVKNMTRVEGEVICR